MSAFIMNDTSKEIERYQIDCVGIEIPPLLYEQELLLMEKLERIPGYYNAFVDCIIEDSTIIYM